jgi:hypothetical protein
VQATTYQLTRGGMINGQAIAPGATIAIVQTPDGVPVERAISAIVSGLAVPAPIPAPIAAPEPAAAAVLEAESPRRTST